MDGSLTIDRLSRSLIDLLGTIHTLEACGVDLCRGALSVLTLILPNYTSTIVGPYYNVAPKLAELMKISSLCYPRHGFDAIGGICWR
jgi:hypothetical protein